MSSDIFSLVVASGVGAQSQKIRNLQSNGDSEGRPSHIILEAQVEEKAKMKSGRKEQF